MDDPFSALDQRLAGGQRLLAWGATRPVAVDARNQLLPWLTSLLFARLQCCHLVCKLAKRIGSYG